MSIEMKNPLENFRHQCISCPLNFLITDDFSHRISTSWSKIYLCDVCHCTRALEEKMFRHLQNESHCSASEYLSDSATMTLHQCVRRSSLKLDEYSTSIIICPICDEVFLTVNTCALHSKLRHSLEFVYSIGFEMENFVWTFQHDDRTPNIKQTKRTISFYFCSIDQCSYRTNDFFELKNHWKTKHHDVSQPINVKIRRFYRPETYFHITRFQQKNLLDLQDEIQTFDELELDTKIPLIFFQMKKNRFELLETMKR